MTPRDPWRRYRRLLCVCDEIGLRLDPSRMDVPEDYLDRHRDVIGPVLDAMEALEAGAVANPDEGRQVGHYWLRAPELAPELSVSLEIEETREAVLEFAGRVHSGDVAPADAARFTDVLVIGIGGSALGPQLVADALGDPETDRLRPHFFDNTDPDGMDRLLRRLGDRLASTLAVVISKSGGTPETRNGMLVAKAAFEARGLDFAGQAVAITGVDSTLDRFAVEQGFLARFPMWDWVGGRTSVMSAVGLLPAALQGLDVDALLLGARECDSATRERKPEANPALQLALLWHHGTGGRGEKDMVILPYKDRLLLFSRYLQQLVMESLGKNRDLAGQPVSQGIAVYGNKGSTDQHAYVQQLREGVDNFFATFIAVERDGGGDAGALEVESGVTAGDYLRGFRLGTREALAEGGRQSITLSIDRLDAHRLGVLIALYERAVGFYASLVNVNAYHQPGVEAGKRAAAAALDLQARVVDAVRKNAGTAEQIAAAAGSDDIETVFHLLEGLAANSRLERRPGDDLFEATYSALSS
ncbi:MAG: glucose-6-phosphate isomerase [Acidobacteriota bacterium]